VPATVDAGFAELQLPGRGEHVLAIVLAPADDGREQGHHLARDPRLRRGRIWRASLGTDRLLAGRAMLEPSFEKRP